MGDGDIVRTDFFMEGHFPSRTSTSSAASTTAASRDPGFANFTIDKSGSSSERFHIPFLHLGLCGQGNNFKNLGGFRSSHVGGEQENLFRAVPGDHGPLIGLEHPDALLYGNKHPVGKKVRRTEKK